MLGFFYRRAYDERKTRKSTQTAVISSNQRNRYLLKTVCIILQTAIDLQRGVKPVSLHLNAY